MNRINKKGDNCVFLKSIQKLSTDESEIKRLRNSYFKSLLK